MLNSPPAWRSSPSISELSPWGSGSSGRALRIVVDHATTAMSPALALLDELVGHDGLEIYTTRGDSQWRVEIGQEPSANSALPVTYHCPGESSVFAIWNGEGALDYGRQIAQDRGLDFADVVRVLRFRQAASSHYLDALVTDLGLPQQTSRPRPGLPLGNVPADRACALVGLYLRAHIWTRIRVARL
jgi:hypothetical protein